MTYIPGEITTHEAAADPHTGYQKESEKAAASGYASLDGSIKIPIAQVPTGTTSSTVAIGNDARLSDSRTPTGSAGGDLAGSTYPNPVVANLAITDAKVAAANKDGAAATPSLRTLGTGAAQALAGNTRLDQITAPTASVSLNNQKITSLAGPTVATDAATMQYVDNRTPKITVASSAPGSPATGDVWIDSS